MEHDANIQTGSVLKLVDRHQIHHNQRLAINTPNWNTPPKPTFTKWLNFGISFIIGVENRGIADNRCVETTNRSDGLPLLPYSCRFLCGFNTRVYIKNQAKREGFSNPVGFFRIPGCCQPHGRTFVDQPAWRRHK